MEHITGDKGSTIYFIQHKDSTVIANYYLKPGVSIESFFALLHVKVNPVFFYLLFANTE